MSFGESNIGFPLFSVLTVTLLIIVGTTGLRGAHPIKDRIAPTLLYLVTAAAGVVGLVFHPSPTGAILTLSMVIVVGVLLAIASFDVHDLRTHVALPLLGASALQSVIVVIQSITGTAFGYNFLYPGASLLVTEGYARPQGMFDHVYEAALFALLAIAVGLALLPAAGRLRMWFLGGIGLGAVSLALTHSRSAFLGLVLVVVVASVASVRAVPSMRSGLAVLLIAFGVPALMTASIWQARLTESVNGSLDEVTSGRITLMKQAVTLAADYPVVGVGPNRYIDALEASVDESEITYVVHNIPLMVTAELGIPAGVLTTFLLVWAAIQSFAAGHRLALLFFAPIPFYVFDVIMYNRPFGLLLYVIWCGILGSMTRIARPSPRSEGANDAHLS